VAVHQAAAVATEVYLSLVMAVSMAAAVVQDSLLGLVAAALTEL